MSVQQVRVHVCLTALGVPELLIYFQFFFEFSRAEVLPGRVFNFLSRESGSTSWCDFRVLVKISLFFEKSWCDA